MGGICGAGKGEVRMIGGGYGKKKEEDDDDVDRAGGMVFVFQAEDSIRDKGM